MVAAMTRLGVAGKESAFVKAIKHTLWRVLRKACDDKCNMKKTPKT